MKVVTYIMLIMAVLMILADWIYITDGVTAIVGSIVIGLAFGWLLVRAANFKEDAQ